MNLLSQQKVGKINLCSDCHNFKSLHRANFQLNILIRGLYEEKIFVV